MDSFIFNAGLAYALAEAHGASTASSQPLSIRPIDGTSLLAIARASGEGRNLRVEPASALKNPALSFSGGEGKWARWELVPLAPPSTDGDSENSISFALKSIATGLFLAPAAGAASGFALAKEATPLCSRVVSSSLLPVLRLSGRNGPKKPRVAEAPAKEERRALTADDLEQFGLSSSDKQAFVRDGLLIVRQAVDPSLADRLREQYNRNIGKLVSRAAQPTPQPQPTLQAPEKDLDNDGEAGGIHDNAPTLQAKKAITNSPKLRAILNSVLCADADLLVGKGQDAVLFPDDGNGKEDSWHCDGFKTSILYNFNLLLTVALSNQTRIDIGNTHVSTGSHWPITRALRRANADPELKLEDGRLVLPRPGTGSRESALAVKIKELAQSQVETLEPITMQAGDIALIHPKLAHRRGLNMSPDVRHLVIFRVASAALKGKPQLEHALEGPFHAAIYAGLHADAPTAELIHSLSAANA
jgi:ectoine hydroxylase-related dioxygenase (phytanoyl-CoA dioxygenase family)